MRRPLFALAFALGAALASLAPGLARATPTPAAVSMTLLSQTPWVGPGQSMQLRLDLSGAPLSALSLTLTLYEHLTSRSAFDETAGGTPVGYALATATVGAASLPANAQGGVDVTVAQSSGDAAASGTGQLNADLDCSPGNCGGVYPLVLQLSAAGGGPGATLTTYLVYANPPAGTEKVRLAWLMPLSLPTSSSGGAEPEVSGASLGQLTALLQVVAAHPADPLTLAPQPADVAALSASTQPAAKAALASMQVLSAVVDHETLASPYVPVDAQTLVSDDLGGELADQVRRGEQALASMRPVGGTWVTTSPVDEPSLATLANLGFSRLVVPAGDVSQGLGPSLTSSAPFTLSAGHGVSPTAVESDAGLSADLAAGTGDDDALAAYRMLADLALVYYEQPNDPTPRGVVASPSVGAPPAPALVDIVLSALQNDPLVSPVTVDQLFAQVPISANGRRPSSPSTTSSLPAHQIRDQRTRMNAFAASVNASGADVVRALDDQLLSAEDDQLRSGQQQQALSTFERALAGQLSTISIRADTIKLTSTAAKVPLTLTKQSGYGVTGTLQVTGDKVVFPGGTAQSPGPVCRSYDEQTSAGRSSFVCAATIDLGTNAVYVDMRARVSGDFRLTVTLTSPTGGLVLASTDITVHSMSTSLVAVGLSAAALVVLLAWWARTVWRRHPPGHGTHVRGRSAGAPTSRS